MKVESYTDDGAREREALAAIVLNSVVCGRVAAKWTEPLFPSRPTNVIAGEAVGFYRKHGKAPRKAMRSLLGAWAEKHSGDKDTIEQLDEIYTAVESSYKARDINPDHATDMVGDYLNRVRFTKLVGDLSADVEAGRLDRAEQRRAAFRRVELGEGAGTDPMTEEHLFDEVFSMELGEPLVTFDSPAYDAFLQDTFARGKLVAYLGGEKTGKSSHLLDLVFRAVSQRRKVVFFDAGDQDRRDVLERLLQRMSGHPVRSPTGKWPYVCEDYPVGIIPPAGDTAIAMPKTEPREFVQVDKEWAERKRQRFMSRVVRSNESHFMCFHAPCDTLSVANIEGILDSLALGGFLADMVVIDYADILCPPDARKEKRHQVDDVWKALRGLSQRRHVLVVTATQANKESYTKRWLDKGCFSDAKYKIAHASTILGINQDEDEKKVGVQRINYPARRHGRTHDGRGRLYAHVAGCLDIANPVMFSC